MNRKSSFSLYFLHLCRLIEWRHQKKKCPPARVFSLLSKFSVNYSSQKRAIFLPAINKVLFFLGWMKLFKLMKLLCWERCGSNQEKRRWREKRGQKIDDFSLFKWYFRLKLMESYWSWKMYWLEFLLDFLISLSDFDGTLVKKFIRFLNLSDMIKIFFVKVH